MKLPSPNEGLITIKSDQKAARKCYKSSLKSRRGVYSVGAKCARWLTSGRLDGQALLLICLLLTDWNNAPLRQRGLFLGLLVSKFKRGVN